MEKNEATCFECDKLRLDTNRTSDYCENCASMKRIITYENFRVSCTNCGEYSSNFVHTGSKMYCRYCIETVENLEDWIQAWKREIDRQ